ncbi:WSC domain-containing protein, partial [Tricladium varicosporioides]
MQLSLIYSSFAIFTTFVNCSPLVHTPRVIIAIPGYDSQGCYTEATNGRALTGSAYYDDAMTVEKCALACTGFTWFGVEYGRECFCGNSISAGSIPAPTTDCNFQCPGNSAQNCGAGRRLNMYSVGGAVTPGSPGTPTPPPPPPPPPPPSTSGFSSLGCYTEGLHGRTLVGKNFASDAMTVEMCALTCAGFKYFGVEYYRECYCGNSLLDGSTAAPETECTHKCMGDNSQLCGGDWRMNLYSLGATTVTTSSSSTTTTPVTTPASTSYSPVGCYTEADHGRALSLKDFYDDQMTVGKCATACKGYDYFGVEYGRECFCGNSFNSGSVPTADSECNFKCPGDNSQLCGAGRRLNVYHFGVASTSTSDSAT